MSVEIENAGDALRNIARKLGTNKVIQNNLNNSLSSFVLLKSSTLSIPAHQKLAATIEKLFPPLYPLHLQESIRLANAVISYILQEKISDVSTVDIKSKAAWDSIVTQMLSGILDFIENNADGVDFSSSFAGLAVISSIARSKEHVAEALYPLLCGFFVDLPTKCKMSVALRNNAYDLLSETVSSHAINQSKLRDKKLLGGERIGYMLSQTKDFILLESLLTLVAWLLPSIKQNSGKAKRTHFIQEVFGSSKWFLCSSEIIQILQNVSTSAWEHTAAKIIDALARSDITFPQPFSLEEIDVCGTVFVQPTDSDRLNMDSQVFFGNIIRNDDTFESFRVPYTSVSSVVIDKSNESAPEGRASIIVHLTSAPLVGNDIMVLKKGEDTSLKFLLHNEDLGRFMETLRRRGVGKLSFHDDSTSNGVKSPQNIYLGSGLKFFDENTSSPIPPRSSFEDKFQHVEQVYRTNERENTPEPEFLVCADSRDNATILTPQDNRLSSGKQVDTIQLTRNFSKLSPVMKLTHQQSFDPEITPIPPASTPIAPSSVKAISKRILRESDDELFDISKDDVPQVRPVVPIRSIKHTPSKKATAKEITVKTIPTAPATRLRGRKIVDSDDEALMSIPHKQTIKRIAHVDTDIDNVFSSQAPNIDRKSLADVRSSSTIVAREEASHAAGAQRNVKSAEVTRTSVSIDAQLNNIAVLREDPVIIIPASPVKQMSVAKNSASVLDSVYPPVTPEMTAGRNPPLKSTKTRVRPKARNTRSKAAKTDPAVLNGPIPVAETPGIQMSPVPVKLAGKRRKRETPEPSAHYDFGTDSEAPLRKKTRSDSKVEVATLDRQSDPLEPNVSHSVRPKKRYGRKGRSSPIVAQVDDHSDDVPKNPRTLRSSLRSTKVNLDRAPHGRETRAAAMRGKAGKTNIIRPYVLERQLKIETMDTYLRQSVPPRTQKEDIKAPPHISSIPAHEDKFHARSQASVATAIQTSKEGHPKRDTEALPAELATLVAPLDKVQPISQPQHNEKTPKVKSKKAPRDEMPIIAPYIKSDNDSSVSFEPSVNDISPMDEIHKETASNAQDYTYIEYYSPLKGSEDSGLSTEVSFKESTPRKPIVMIDLTSPASEERSAVPTQVTVTKPMERQPSVLLHPHREPQQMEMETSDQEVDETTRVDMIVEPQGCNADKVDPARKRQSVSFAPHVEMLLFASIQSDTDAHLEITAEHLKPEPPTSAVSSRTNSHSAQCSSTSPKFIDDSVEQSLAVDEDVFLAPARQTFSETRSSYAPLKDLTRHASRKDKTARTTPRQEDDGPIESRGTTPSQAKCGKADDEDIQEIAKVLHDIQEVLLAGISSKTKAVKKEVSVGRTKLVQNAVRDVRELSTKNARHFNAMIALEEEYATYRRTITHRWESLIKSNEGFSTAMTRAIEEHDRNVSSKSFPKYISPPKAACLKIRRGAD